MNKQKISSLIQEIVEVAEELLEKQQGRDLTMFHVDKEVKTDVVLKKSFTLLNKKYNTLLKLAIDNGLVSEEDSFFFNEVDEDSFGDVLIDAALLGRYLKEEKSYKIVTHCHSNGDKQLDTEVEELSIDEERLAAEGEELDAMEAKLRSRNIKVKFDLIDE